PAPGEERDDVHARQYVLLPSGQPAADSGVIPTAPSRPHPTGAARGGRFEHASRTSRGPPTRRIGRVARHWPCTALHQRQATVGLNGPRTFDPCILRRSPGRGSSPSRGPVQFSSCSSTTATPSSSLDEVTW